MQGLDDALEEALTAASMDAVDYPAEWMGLSTDGHSKALCTACGQVGRPPLDLVEYEHGFSFSANSIAQLLVGCAEPGPCGFPHELLFASDHAHAWIHKREGDIHERA